jgi:hypothetical protein
MYTFSLYVVYEEHQKVEFVRLLELFDFSKHQKVVLLEILFFKLYLFSTHYNCCKCMTYSIKRD